MSFLGTIIAHKRQEIASKKRSLPRSGLESMPCFRREPFSLVKTLREKDPSFIAEIKNVRSSNFIRNALNPLTVAEGHIRAGAAAIAIPTDEKFALGRLECIDEIRNHVAAPILQRDYIIDSYQLYEARAHGADAVILMAAVLEPCQIADLVAEAEVIGLECVVEVHDEDELDPLDLSTFETISVNNRDPHSFEMDVHTSVRLKKRIPTGKIVIADGGIVTTNEVDLLLGQGIHAFLIGCQPGNAGTSAKKLNDLIAMCQQRAAKLDLFQMKK
jgi:indole-3-glycerol phosphate synthase